MEDIGAGRELAFWLKAQEEEATAMLSVAAQEETLKVSHPASIILSHLRQEDLQTRAENQLVRAA